MYSLGLYRVKKRRVDVFLFHKFPNNIKPLNDKNSSGDEIANLNLYAVRPEATRIRWNNAK